jgi:threonine synthase
VGMTPLYRLSPRAGRPPLARLWIKDDTRLPSGSSKDRASLLAVAGARERGAGTIAAASTGNAASSIALLCAAAGLDCTILAPATAPPAKLLQIRAHGARLIAVEASYDDAFDLCAELCKRCGFYSRNTATNPVLGEGKKTIALEIWEQLGYRTPGWVVVAAGDGCILGGIEKGFRDLLEIGLIDRPPRLLGVQAAGAAPLAHAWMAGDDRCQEEPARTLADSICVARPRDQVKALRAARRSGGGFVTVTDEAILQAQGALATRAGILAEPAAAAAWAGMLEGLRAGMLDPEDEIVVVLTGHGLKDTRALEAAARENPATPAPPDLEAIVRLLGAEGR